MWSNNTTSLGFSSMRNSFLPFIQSSELILLYKWFCPGVKIFTMATRMTVKTIFGHIFVTIWYRMTIKDSIYRYFGSRNSLRTFLKWYLMRFGNILFYIQEYIQFYQRETLFFHNFELPWLLWTVSTKKVQSKNKCRNKCLNSL